MKRRYAILSLLLILLILAVTLSLTVFKPYIKSIFYIDHMERTERTDRMHITRIIDTLHIGPEDTVADIGAGSGLFTRMFATKASRGTVYAVDINLQLLKHVEKTCREKGIKNISTVHASENDPKIPVKVDLVFICDTLHYIDKQPEYVKAMSSYLKPGGRIAVVSFRENWPPMARTFTKDDLTQWMKQAGLEPVSSHDFIQDEYLNIYRKK